MIMRSSVGQQLKLLKEKWRKNKQKSAPGDFITRTGIHDTVDSIFFSLQSSVAKSSLHDSINEAC